MLNLKILDLVMYDTGARFFRSRLAVVLDNTCEGYLVVYIFDTQETVNVYDNEEFLREYDSAHHHFGAGTIEHKVVNQ